MSETAYSAGDVLRHVWWVSAVAFGVSLVATPIARYVAYRTKIVDRPDDLLKPHGRPVAYLGGVAMCVGLLAGLIGYVSVDSDMPGNWAGIVNAFAHGQWGSLLDNRLWNLMGIGVGCIVITCMGLMDDIVSLKPRQKLIWQAAAAAILLLAGVGDQMTIGLLTLIPVGFVWPSWLVVPTSALMCIMFVIATCNATNLLDGLDGLCGGVTEIIALGFLALAVWLAMWGRDPQYDELRIVLSLAMAGAILGFLPYNIPPASIFMGDAGSMLLGYFVATMMAMFCQEGNVRWLLGALVVYALPLSDTSLAVVRRFLGKKGIFSGDRSHLYDQLVDRGMTVKQVVVLFYFLAALAAITGVAIAVFLRLRQALPTVVALGIVVWLIFYKLKMIKPPPHEAHKK